MAPNSRAWWFTRKAFGIFWDCLLRAKEEVQCLAHDFLKEIFTEGIPPEIP